MNVTAAIGLRFAHTGIMISWNVTGSCAVSLATDYVRFF